MARGGKEEGEKHIGLLKLAQTLSFLLIFMAGIIIGLAASSHIDRYFNSLPRMFSSTTNLQSIPFSTPDYSNCTIIHRDCTGNDENDDGGGGVKAEKPKDRDCWSIDGDFGFK